MKDLLGTRFNFTVAAWMPEQVCVRILDADGQRKDLSGTTWECVMVREGASDKEVTVQHGSDVGELILSIPGLGGGTWSWALTSISDGGERQRVLYGAVTAFVRAEADAAVQSQESAILRTLDVQMGPVAGAVATLRWCGSSVAAQYAAEAKKAADVALGMEAILTEGVLKSEAALKAATDAVDKLAALDELLEAFQNELALQVHISDNGTWVIGGIDSGHPAQGPAGADGKDGAPGLDGDKIQGVRVDSVDDIPEEGGGVRYYVLNDGEWNVYEWVTEEDGTKTLVQISGAIPLASTTTYGLAKLGSDTVLSAGADVGLNANGGLRVPEATVSALGSVKPSTSRTPAAACIGKFANGSLGCTMATLTEPGVIQLGSAHAVNNRLPYLFSVGSHDNKLCNNILLNGALKHMTKQNWLGSGMEWLGELDDAGYQLGLFSSPQFEQSEDDGLVLKPATTELLAGVHLATGLDDAREAAVLKTADVVENFPQKSAMDNAIAAAVAEVKRWVQTEAPTAGELPVGFISWAACASAEGWLLCDGSEVSREDYPRLFDAISTRFGAGSDNTTFKLPDLRNRVAWGASGNAGTYKAPGLPELWGSFGKVETEAINGNLPNQTGVFSHSTGQNQWCGMAGGGYRTHSMIEFRASAGNAIYGASSTVQPPALCLNAFIKF